MDGGMIYTREITEEYTFPNITLYKKYRDGVHYAWFVAPEEGYVMYDTTDENFEIDPVTMEEIPVTYYYTMVNLPLKYDFDNFPWRAVAMSDVEDPTHIY